MLVLHKSSMSVATKISSMDKKGTLTLMTSNITNIFFLESRKALNAQLCYNTFAMRFNKALWRFCLLLQLLTFLMNAA